MASISVQSGEASLTVVISGLDTAFSRSRFFVWQLSTGGSLVVDETTTESPYIASTSNSFSGLIPGRTYSVVVGIYESDWTPITTLSSSGSPGYYTIIATVSFDANGGSVSPSQASGSAQSATQDGNVSVLFPTPTRQGYILDYWELRDAVTIYSTRYYPGYNTVYAGTWGYQYTAKAIWKEQPASRTFIYHNNEWVPATPYIYHNGIWVEAEPFIYSGGWK